MIRMIEKIWYFMRIKLKENNVFFFIVEGVEIKN